MSSKKKFSQTSRDRLAFNFLIALPVLVVAMVIRHAQTTKTSP